MAEKLDIKKIREAREFQICSISSDDAAIRIYSHELDVPHEYRDNFERDRDRILYSKEFRRLCGKTQVFLVGYDDNVRTRLTHTLEVAQIAKTICRCLGLNETLAEAIAYGHDVGHTPFGHVGERTLNLILSGCDPIKIDREINDANKGFKHNWQSVRVVSHLEKISDKFPGLNLTKYTLWGILHHSSIDYVPCKFHSRKVSDGGKETENYCAIRQNFFKCPHSTTLNPKLVYYRSKYEEDIGEEYWSFEALTVKMADEIAQRNHDIQDGIFAGIIDVAELFDKIEEFFKPHLSTKDEEQLKKIKTIHKKNMSSKNSPLIMSISQFVVNFLVTNLLDSASKNLRNYIKEKKIKSNKEFLKKKKTDTLYKTVINYDETFKSCDMKFKGYLFTRIISSHVAQCMDGKAHYILRGLVKCFISNPQQLPDSTIVTVYRNAIDDGIIDDKTLKKKIKNSLCYYSLSLIGECRARLNDDIKEKSHSLYAPLLRTIADYIAGMTDSYALELFDRLYLP